ncbi:MAG: hypothetical protein JWL59_4369 [Chthoniobacteraceae bacterium]|nr:hypothetical protein [Chthoniobacteraceae bacterium]
MLPALPITPRFDGYRTDALCSKAWILPDLIIIPLKQMHFRWILEHHVMLSQRYQIDFSGLPAEEQPVRLHALNHGFVRVNYERNRGRLTVEANTAFLGLDLQNVIAGLITGNIDLIDNVRVHWLNTAGVATRVVRRNLVGMGDADKISGITKIFVD